MIRPISKIIKTRKKISRLVKITLFLFVGIVTALPSTITLIEVGVFLPKKLKGTLTLLSKVPKGGRTSSKSL